MAGTEEIVRFTVSIPRKLLGEIDRRVIGGGYHSRSEFVRDLIRERIVDDVWSSGEAEVVGVLTIGYDHHQRQLVERLIELQHDHHVNVLCSTHVHVSHDFCLEAIVLRGLPAEIERLCFAIGGLRGVKTAGLTRASRVEF